MTFRIFGAQFVEWNFRHMLPKVFPRLRNQIGKIQARSTLCVSASETTSGFGPPRPFASCCTCTHLRDPRLWMA